MQWLVSPPVNKDKPCQRSINTQGFVVCEDALTYSDTTKLHALNDMSLLLAKHPPKTPPEPAPILQTTDQTNKSTDQPKGPEEPTCIVWSVIATKTCDDLGTMEFEREMAKRGCQVELFQYLIDKKGQRCPSHWPSQGGKEGGAMQVSVMVIAIYCDSFLF